jgi:hypothetical protein
VWRLRSAYGRTTIARTSYARDLVLSAIRHKYKLIECYTGTLSVIQHFAGVQCPVCRSQEKFKFFMLANLVPICYNSVFYFIEGYYPSPGGPVPTPCHYSRKELWQIAQARSQIRSRVIAKSIGSEEPVFTSMGVLLYGLWLCDGRFLNKKNGALLL